jgi:hypothetical protein
MAVAWVRVALSLRSTFFRFVPVKRVGAIVLPEEVIAESVEA